MNRKGFTLVEILAVIAIIAVLSIVLVPNIIENYKNSTDKAMQLQENESLDGAKLFVEDFCRNPISSNHKCSNYEKTSTSGFVYFCLSTLQSNIAIPGFDSEPYLPGVNFKGGVPCDGFIKFTKNGNAYEDGKAYLVCKNPDETEYGYATEGYEAYTTELNSCLSKTKN
ncbi:MAG: prepilin-type N-terminal cleavage/methylation domain-containing protein [Bacilli bacterium]|nr:prepilin-type N-terminal cleavage/methylation domain-containing protein [Bacilli bacterium]